MLSIRQSNAVSSNVALDEIDAQPDESNSAWLNRVGAKDGVILLGGASVAHFRIRVAQSHARADSKPSAWSVVGMLMADQTFLSVPLDLRGEASEVPLWNGVQTCKMADYDNPAQFPNIAVVRFTSDHKKILDLATVVCGDLEKRPAQRGIIDLPALMLPWLSYIWIVGKAPNPLTEGIGLPSAAFVETIYGMAGIELTPGLASSTSCPEAIWQAAKYWHEFYEQASAGTQETDAAHQIPTGHYAQRQKAAAVTWPIEKKY